MVMIPQAEYQALLNLMTKTGDALQDEKVKLDEKIATTLDDKKINPEIKAKKYNWLYKQRRQISGMLENRPQKVVIQSQADQPSNFAPYLGLSNIKPNIETGEDEERGIKKSLIKKKKSREPTSVSESEYSSVREPNDSIYETTRSSSHFTSSSEIPNITPDQKKKLLSHIKENKEKFRIAEDGRILSYRNLPVKQSNFQESIDYLTGNRDSPPKGHKYFEHALRRDSIAKDILFKTQTGKGIKKVNKRRKIIVKFAKKHTIIKTPGLNRIPISNNKSFKPQIWTKL